MDDDRRAARPDGDDARRSDASTDDPPTSGVAPANATVREASAAEPGRDAPDDEYDDPFRRPIEPESVDLEHAAFVILGAVLTVAIVASAL